MRDDFPTDVKETLARRAGMRCSSPNCRKPTSGPRDNPEKAVNIGVAAHIAAASPGGPRHDSGMSSDERKSIENGTWLCQNCAKLVDNDPARFTADILRGWKHLAEEAARLAVETRTHAVDTRRELRIRISPTWQRRRLLAQIRLFNAGHGPIYISQWYVAWGPDGSRSARSSIRCEHGSLPARIQEQDAHELLVDITDPPLEELSTIGVFDGNDTLWEADESEIKIFVHIAVMHRPPGIEKSAIDEEALRKCEVDIETQCIDRGPNRPKRLQVAFYNKGSVPIRTCGADVSWEYDPPRDMPETPGQPQVSEVGGSIGLSTEAPNVIVNPGDQKLFFLDDRSSPPLTQVLADDVQDESIAIVVRSDTKICWKATGDEVPAVVRDVARSVIETQEN